MKLQSQVCQLAFAFGILNSESQHQTKQETILQRALVDGLREGRMKSKSIFPTVIFGYFCYRWFHESPPQSTG